MQEKIKTIIKKRFPEIKFKKITLYKNPCEFNHIYIEKVNPDHVGILWGKRKKNLNKGCHYIQFGKVYYGIILLTYGLNVVAWVDMLTNYAYYLLATVGLLTLITCSITTALLYYIPVKMDSVKPCLRY